MRKNLLITIVMIFAMFGSILAQQKITGTVTDAADGSPIIGANIILEGTNAGTITDFDGNFSLQAPAKGGSLVISFIGYSTKKVEIGSQTVINVQLAIDSKQVDEVVVTALGIKRDKKALGYSVTELKTDDMTQARETNMVNSLSGKVAGVQISQSAGGPGGSTRVVIRGNSSIGGNNQPLFVVDGVPIDNSNFGGASYTGGIDYGSGVTDINPDDVESMTVLKGPNAAALYGSRAQNGVILITTKKGSSKKGIGVTVSSNVTWDVPVLLTDWQNEYGMGGNGDLIKSVIKPDFRAKWKIDPAIDSAYFTQDWTSYGSWGPKMDGQMDVMNWYGQMSKFNPQPDNVKDFYQTGNTYTNSVAIEGGNDKATFRLSYTNLENKGIVPTNRLGRNTINFRGTNKFTDQLEADFKVTYVRQENKNRTGVSNSSTNPAMVFVRMPRNVEMSKLKEYYLAPDGSEANWYMEGTNENPYWGVYKNGNKDFRDRITSNVSLLYKPLEWLSLKVNTGTDFYNEKRDLWVATNSLSTTYKDGRYREMTINVKENNSEFLFMINKNFLDDFDFSLNLGGNRMYQYSFTNSSEVIGFAVPDFYSLNNIKDKLNRFESTYKSEKRVNALYASGQFAYKNYLFLDFTARNDWSSTLPKGSNSYFYPSVSLSYAITDALKLNSKYLTFGKIRLAWAKVGNDTEPYRLSPVYSMGEPYGSQPTNVLPLTLPLANLKPESTVSIEVGGDFRFFDNRLGLDLSLYKKNTSNQILDSKISKATGYDAAWINAGEIENKGIEILLNLTTFKTTDWRWDMTINWSKNISKVISLAEGMDSYQIAYNSQATIEARPGEPYGNIVGKAIARWYNYTDSTQTTIADHPGNGKKWVSPEGLYNVGKTEVIGNITPDWIGGISNTISYKNISFSFAIGMQQGGDILSWTNKYLIDQGQTKETLEGRESWYNGTEEQRIAGTVGYVADGVTDKGDVNTKGIDPQKYFHESYKYNGIAETCVYDISYIKLREMILAYTLPKSLLSKTPFSKASISFVGRNLWLIKSNIPNIDPESTFSSENSALGQEWGSLPPSRNWGFNLSLSF